MQNYRRSDYDVTDTVRVSSPADVLSVVSALLEETYPGESFTQIQRAFRDFELLFTGQREGYLGCDTVYHDTQHTLDMTLAMARLIAGYERTYCGPPLGSERAKIGVTTALFHDSGYIRSVDDKEHVNGAEFTPNHVSRSAEYLEQYLPEIDMADAIDLATTIVHFTGYEMKLEDIVVDDECDRLLGHLVGTADLIAQMADRCYLEKCRDRLYPEFVLGGISFFPGAPDDKKVAYRSPNDLLRQTPEFFRQVLKHRLDGVFNGAYRYVEALFDGQNPYLDAIRQNLDYLKQVLADENWSMLRRKPPCFAWQENPVTNIQQLAEQKIKRYA